MLAYLPKVRYPCPCRLLSLLEEDSRLIAILFWHLEELFLFLSFQCLGRRLSGSQARTGWSSNLAGCPLQLCPTEPQTQVWVSHPVSPLGPGPAYCLAFSRPLLGAAARATGAQEPRVLPLRAPHFPEGPFRAPLSLGRGIYTGDMHQWAGRAQPGVPGGPKGWAPQCSCSQAQSVGPIASCTASKRGGQDTSLQCRAEPALAGPLCSPALRGLPPSVGPLQMTN